MSTISVSLPSDGETIDASDYNTPITTIVNEFNGNIDNDNIKSAAAISGTKLADASVAGGKLGSPYCPQGYLQNGVISRTVATNDITVAIKTLAGTDPSASDPVYVRIGNTVRSITSALSVTKNDGTNWFNSGASEHATQDIDYFVYLGYNTTDGVVIGFARIPYARVYGDFSTTTTNDKYCAISTITNAASTDEYELIGRFNATLSATASFNWSIPATSIVISRPVFYTRPLTWSPTWTGITPGNGVNSNTTYVINGKNVVVRGLFTGGTTSSGTGVTPVLTLPLTAGTYSANTVSVGTWRYGSSSALFGYVRATSTTTFSLVSLAVSGATIIDANLPVAFTNTYTLGYTAEYEAA